MPKYPIKLDGVNPEMGTPYPMESCPMLYVYTDKELDLPDSGEMTVTFTVSKASVENRDDKKKYEVCLKIHEITSVKESEVEDDSDEEETPEEALDKLAEDSEMEGE